MSSQDIKITPSLLSHLSHGGKKLNRCLNLSIQKVFDALAPW